LLGLHRWQQLRSDEGGAYNKCRVCGKFSDIPDRPYIPGGN
jgi:hypothetical protein